MLHDILWRNQGQVLTPELILGILQGNEYTPEKFLPLDILKPLSLNGKVCSVERFFSALPELRELHQTHYEETEAHRSGIPLNPDYEGYCQRDRDGTLLQFTVRQEGVLVGQCLMLLYVSTQNQVLKASEDALYLKPEARGELRFFRQWVDWMEKYVRKIGVRSVTLTSKSINSADKLMMRCGYKPVATQLTKVFED